MRFDLIRLVLNPVSNMFAEEASREQWLRLTFSEPFSFVHRRGLYHFVPTASAGLPYIMGMVGRPKIVREHEPPEAMLEAVTRETWIAARVFIDPRSHEDGQKVSFERTGVGEPMAVMRNIAATINARMDAPYRIVANPITPLESFLSFLEAHPRDITFIQFDMNAPNMFSDKTNVDEEMRAARERYHARKARVSLANEDGMSLNDPKILEMAEYVSKGGGKVTAKAQDKDVFHSQKKIESDTIDVPEDAGLADILHLLINRVFRR